MAVFGWWLYSFINYAKKEYQLEYNNLKLNAQVIQNKITEFIEFRHRGQKGSPYETYKIYEKEIINLHKDLNQSFKVKTNLSLIDTTGTMFHMTSITINESEFKAIE